MKRIWLLAALTALAAAWLTAPAATAATAQQTIAELNAQRAANGIPAGLTENSTYSADCAKHDHYMAVNHTLTNTEQPGAPGYSAEGDFAGRNSVLTLGGSWDNGNLYEFAPFHLDQLLAPRLATLGSADSEGFSCTTTLPGWIRPDPPNLVIYTYPGNGTTIYPSEVESETPWTPGDLAGLPQPTRTGPILLVFVDAPGQTPFGNPAILYDATVSGPAGPVTVKTIDGNTALPPGSPYPTAANYISPGGFIIPVRPLIPATTYHAHVVVVFGGVETPYDWTFTTDPVDPGSSLTANGAQLFFSSKSRQPIRVSFTRTGGGSSSAITIRPGKSRPVMLSPGTWQACGHQPPGGGFAAYDHCLTLIVTGVPVLHLSKARIVRSKVRVNISFSAVLGGRRATLTLTSLRLRCAHGGCRSVVGSSSRRSIMLRAKSLEFALPAHGRGFEIDIRTAAFELHAAPWAAAHALTVFVRR